MEKSITKSMSNQSIRTVKSSRSVRSIRSGRLIHEVPAEKSIDFEKYLPFACAKFNCPLGVVVIRETENSDYFKLLKTPAETTRRKRIQIVAPQSVAITQDLLKSTEKQTDDETSCTTVDSYEENKVKVTAVYDCVNRLKDIIIKNERKVPRIMMQVINLLAPFYQKLTKISITMCRIDVYTIHELSKMMTSTTITDVCFDNSPLAEANYAILLDTPSHLKNLSLSGCRINDEVCKLIASKLHFTCSAEKTLLTLNLSSNQITDEGAKYIGKALRTNRHLRYLNMADNHITDEGASHIFEVLIEFVLTYDETQKTRLDNFEYLKTRDRIYIQILNDLENQSVDEVSVPTGRKSLAKRKSSMPTKVKPRKDKTIDSMADGYNHTRATMMAFEILGPFVNPFSKDFITTRDNQVYCLGNFVLCYLNLSYNNLSYLSVKKLLHIVSYQSVIKKLNQAGLIKVHIEGNYLPIKCAELDSLAELMNRNLGRPSSRHFPSRRKSSYLHK